MPKAYVLITVNTGSETAVIKDLKGISAVKEAHIVYGVYDIIAKVETDRMEDLKDIISTKVRRIPNIRSTLTMIVLEGS